MAKKRTPGKKTDPDAPSGLPDRSLWKGTLTLGLVNIPIRLIHAVRTKDVRFHMLHQKDHSRVRQKLVCAAEDKEISRDEVVKGYPIGEGHVVMEPEETERLAPKTTHSMDIVQFIDEAPVDPAYFDRPFYAVPEKGAEKAYELLRQALEQTRHKAVIRFVMREKEAVGILRPDRHLLCVETLHYADEVMTPDELRWQPPQVQIREAELKMAVNLIESMTEKLELEKFRDDYREALMNVITQKAEGRHVVAAPASKGEPEVIDLMAALQKSLQHARQKRAA